MDSRVIIAVETGDLQAVRELLPSFRENINTKFFPSVERDGESHLSHSTLLILASRQGHADVVNELLGPGGAAIGLMDDEGHTALHWAVQMGHESTVLELLDHHEAKTVIDETIAVIDYKHDGYTPLMLAIEYNHLKLVRLLLCRHAAKDKSGDNRPPPLYLAAIRGHLEAMDELLNAFDREAINQAWYNRTALMLAADEGHAAIVELLLRRRAATEHKNDHNETALFYAVRSGNDNVVSLLLENKAKTDPKNDLGDTALILATKLNRPNIMRLLLDKNREIINEVDKCKLTALNTAARQGNLELVRILLSYGAAIAPIDQDGSTALHAAVFSDNVEVLQELLKDPKTTPAVINMCDKAQETALDTAIRYGNKKMVAMLTCNAEQKRPLTTCQQTTFYHAAEESVEKTDRGVTYREKRKLGART